MPIKINLFSFKTNIFLSFYSNSTFLEDIGYSSEKISMFRDNYEVKIFVVCFSNKSGFEKRPVISTNYFHKYEQALKMKQSSNFSHLKLSPNEKNYWKSSRAYISKEPELN